VDSFDGAERVEGFDFDEEIYVGWGELVDANDRSVADGAEDVVEFLLHTM